MKIGYVRVSTVEQNEARQMVTMEKYGVEKVFQEKVSAKDTNRPQLKAMLEFAREGDTIYVHDFSRLARSTKDLLDIVETLKRKGIALVSNKESVDTNTPTGMLMLTMIAAIYQFERENLLERQREGIAIAKREGKYKGYPGKVVKDFDRYYQDYLSRKITKTKLAELLNISRPTLNKLIAQHQ